jgi:hypothetical protein
MVIRKSKKRTWNSEKQKRNDKGRVFTVLER